MNYIPKDTYELYLNNHYTLGSGSPVGTTSPFPKIPKVPIGPGSKFRIMDFPNIVLPKENIIVITGPDPIVAPNIPTKPWLW